MPAKYTVFPHTADIGLRVQSRTLKGLFTVSAQGMSSILFDTQKIRPLKKVKLTVRSDSAESLLVDWLQEILYHITVKHLALAKFRVESLSGTTLKGCAYGEPLSPSGPRLLKEIKAVTYHNLKVKKSRGLYRVALILDI